MTAIALDVPPIHPQWEAVWEATITPNSLTRLRSGGCGIFGRLLPAKTHARRRGGARTGARDLFASRPPTPSVKPMSRRRFLPVGKLLPIDKKYPSASHSGGVSNLGVIDPKALRLAAQEKPAVLHFFARCKKAPRAACDKGG